MSKKKNHGFFGKHKSEKLKNTTELTPEEITDSPVDPVSDEPLEETPEMSATEQIGESFSEPVNDTTEDYCADTAEVSEETPADVAEEPDYSENPSEDFSEDLSEESEDIAEDTELLSEDSEENPDIEENADYSETIEEDEEASEISAEKPKKQCKKPHLPRGLVGAMKDAFSSKITKKLLFVVTIAMVIMVAVLLIVSVSVAKDNTDEIVTGQVSVGVDVLKFNMQLEQDRINEFADNWISSHTVAKAVEDISFADVKSGWTMFTSSQSDFFAVCNAKGEILYKSDSFKLAEPQFDLALNGTDTISGIFTDSAVPLSFQYIAPVSDEDLEVIGALIVGMDLSECSYLQSVKQQTGTDVALFAGNTRYASTFLDADGNPIVGTQMSGNIESEVMESTDSYFVGKNNVNGENYYVDYRPMVDYNGNIVGAYFSGMSSAATDKSFGMLVLISVVCAILVLIAADILLMLMTRKMIGMPIAEANKIAENMRTGQLNLPDSDFKFGDDEIGDFSKRLEDAKHTLQNYVSDISCQLSRMGRGDFSSISEMEYIGDFVEIKTSFLEIQENLSGLITNINNSADSVMIGAQTMAEGTQHLADGTFKQTTAIQTLIEAIDNISGQIEANAKNAGEANDIAKGTAEVIEKQDEQIDKMHLAMQEIKEQSSKIDAIMKTIQDIAFQTNILALNAAIEAARAGDAGKGFAVVADEVRNLATKSAEAATTTEELISATLKAVDNGTLIAQSTSESMANVKEYSNRTADIINRINDASVRQADAVRRVEIDVEDIRSVTEQNSATAEESAASCEQLSGMSEHLKNQLSKLKA